MKEVAHQLNSYDTGSDYQQLPVRIDIIKDRLDKLKVATIEKESNLKKKQEQSQQLDQNLKELSDWLENVNNRLEEVNLSKTLLATIEDDKHATEVINIILAVK